MWICIRTRVCMFVCISSCLYVCVCICVYAQGEEQWAAGEENDAIKSWLHAAALDRHTFTHVHKLGVAYDDKRQFDTSYAFFARAAELTSDNRADVLWDKAFVLEKVANAHTHPHVRFMLCSPTHAFVHVMCVSYTYSCMCARVLVWCIR